ncbi:MAG: hypothetical protein QM503_09965 [Bacteroidota bacterium]
MKIIKILPIVFAILVSFSAIAQEDDEMKTLFKRSSSEKMSNGGYGSFSIGYSQVDSKDALQLGGRVAWIANHRFALGLAGYGFVNTMNKNYSADIDPSNYFLAGGYGGVFFEPIIMPNSPVHVSFPILLGVGGISAVEADNWENSSHYDNKTQYYDADAFLVFEPGVDVEFNIVKFFRIAVGASYRLTNGVNLRYKYLDNDYAEHIIQIDKNALDSFTFNIGFKFGWF